jgi:hypothetical protein
MRVNGEQWQALDTRLSYQHAVDKDRGESRAGSASMPRVGG